MYPNVHRCTVYNSQGMEATQMPISRRMMRKLQNIYRMAYYSAWEKNTFKSVLKRWMKLEPIIQSELSQEEQHQCSILTYIYGLQKDVNDKPVCETAKDTKMYRRVFWILWVRQGQTDLGEWHCTMYIIKCDMNHQSRFDA